MIQYNTKCATSSATGMYILASIRNCIERCRAKVFLVFPAAPFAVVSDATYYLNLQDRYVLFILLLASTCTDKFSRIKAT